MTDTNQTPVPDSFLSSFGAPTAQPNGLRVVPAIDSRDAIEAAMLSNGNMALAGEKLQKKFNLPAAPTEQEVTILLSRDLAGFKQAIQTNLVVSLYSIIDTAIDAARRSLPHLEPKDAVHAATQLINQLNLLTDDKTHTQNINVNEYVFKQLDPEMRQLMAQLKALETAGSDEPQIVDAESSEVLD